MYDHGRHTPLCRLPSVVVSFTASSFLQNFRRDFQRRMHSARLRKSCHSWRHHKFCDWRFERLQHNQADLGPELSVRMYSNISGDFQGWMQGEEDGNTSLRTRFASIRRFAWWQRNYADLVPICLYRCNRRFRAISRDGCKVSMIEINPYRLD